MLEIYLFDADEKNVINSNDAWLNKTRFTDRFGYNPGLECLSTGCKAALFVLRHPDKIIDTKECGWDSLSFIVSKCKNGCIVMSDPEITFMGYSGGTIDVQIDNYEIFTVDRLNQYFQDERFSGFVEDGKDIRCLG